MTPKEKLGDYSSKIKDIYIELDDYKFFHSPFALEKTDKHFIGRRRAIDRLKMILKDSHSKSGAYLIAGFRGMGKTSLVRKALSELSGKRVEETQKEEIEAAKKKETDALNKHYGKLTCRVYWSIVIPLLFLILFGILKAISPLIFSISTPTLVVLFFPKQIDIFLCIPKELPVFYTFLLFLFFWIWYRWSLFRRAASKTNKLIADNIKNENDYYSIEINLSQDAVKDFDVLRQMAKQLLSSWEDLKLPTIKERIKREHLIGYQIDRFFRDRLKSAKDNYLDLGYRTILANLTTLNLRLRAEVSTQKELKIAPQFGKGAFWGLFRTNVSIFDYSSKDMLNYPIADSKEVESELIVILRKIDELRTEREKADEEKTKISDFRKIPQFIFVIDELDKIEPNAKVDLVSKLPDDPSGFNHTFYSDKSRQRQEIIAKLLANLKSFLNVAMAKFIFIGGREMYDASLADIADRDSFYSSIFHDIIYLNSFFKEKIQHRSGVTRMTEAFLTGLIIPKQFLLRKMLEKELNKIKSGQLLFQNALAWEDSDLLEYLGILGENPDGETISQLIEATLSETTAFINITKIAGEKIEKGLSTQLESELQENYTLKSLTDYLTDKTLEDNANEEYPKIKAHEKEKLFKIIFILQNLIIYLTYRSNGTPKKLRSLLEGYMRKYDPEEIKNNKAILSITRSKPYLNDKEQDKKEKIFLKFTYNDQYEIGLTSSLYRPYLIIHSRYLKSLGDKLLFSSAYIMDHIMKFHAVAFNWRSLELLPEVILVNKEPNLRGFIEELMAFMTNLYIQPTISGLFSFKFYNKIANEIKLISKISELSSAAFNFTLDESRIIKQHYSKKLTELENRNRHFLESHEGNRFVHSISFIHNIMGDLYYNDKEFDDAILHYTDSIQYLRGVAPEKMTKHQFILLVRTQLKLGLTLEKIRAFDSAFSIHQSLILDIPDVLKKMIQFDSHAETFEKVAHGPYRGMQLLNYAFPASLCLIEKQRFDGVTYSNLERNYKLFNEVILPQKKLDRLYNSRQEDVFRIKYLEGDYLTNVGRILFFKNKIFPQHFAALEQLDKIDFQNKTISEEVRMSWFMKQMGGETKASEEKKWGLPQLVAIDYSPAVSAYVTYRKALTAYLWPLEKKLKGFYEEWVMPRDEKLIPFAALNDISKVTLLLYKEAKHLVNANGFNALGVLISNIGDAVLGMIATSGYTGKKKEEYVLDTFFPKDADEADYLSFEKIQNNLIQKILKWAIHFRLPDGNEKLEKHRPEEVYQLNFVIAAYRIASLLFIRGGNSYKYAFQFNKLLYVIKEHIVFATRKDKKSNFKNDYLLQAQIVEKVEQIAGRFYKAITWANDASNRPQLMKYRDVLSWHDKNKNSSTLYNNLSSSIEVREMVLLVEEIMLKIHRLKCEDNSLEFECNRIKRKYDLERMEIGPYSTNNSRFVRMLDLKFRCEMNYFILAQYLGLKILFDRNIEKTADEALKELLTEELKKQEYQKLKEYLDKDSKVYSEEDLKAYLEEKFEASGNEDFKAYLDEKTIEYRKDSKTIHQVLIILQNKIAIQDGKIREKTEQESAQLNKMENLKIEDLFDGNSAEHLELPDLIDFLITDSVFCLFEMIKILNLFGVNYMTNYSYLANAHFKLANWCQATQNFHKILKAIGLEDKVKASNDELKRLIDSDASYYLEPNYHNELAIQHYYSALQMHQEGKAYHDNLNNLFFLENDLHDDLYHFGAALERFKVNTGLIRTKIDDLKEIVNDSRMYQHQKYLRREENI